MKPYLVQTSIGDGQNADAQLHIDIDLYVGEQPSGAQSLNEALVRRIHALIHAAFVESDFLVPTAEGFTQLEGIFVEGQWVDPHWEEEIDGSQLTDVSAPLMN